MMPLNRYLLSALVALPLLALDLQAQAPADQMSIQERQMVLTVMERIHAFVDELDDLSSAVRNAPGDVYPDLVKRYNFPF